MTMSDYGISLEIIGFILLLFSGNRNPTSAHLVSNRHKEDPFDTLRSKIIPDKFVHYALIFGIVSIIIGLILQLSNFNHL